MNTTYMQARNAFRSQARTSADVYELNAIYRMQFLLNHFGKTRFFGAMYGRHYMLELWKYDILHWIIAFWIIFLVLIEYSDDVYQAVQQFVVELFQTVFWLLTIPWKIFCRLRFTRPAADQQNINVRLPEQDHDDSDIE